MGSTYHLRVATAADAAIIARHRAAMFRDMGELDDSVEVESGTRDQVGGLLASGDYQGWLVETNSGDVAAGLGILLRRRLPRMGNLSGAPEAYVLNVYTEPSHRRRGLATMLLERAADWCRGRGINRLTLHASDEGRRVYARLGFEPTNEMRWIIASQRPD